MIIGTPIPHRASLPIDFVKSLLGAKRLFVTHEGASIPDNRNNLFERARFEGQDLLFIDSDMAFTSRDVDRVEKLLSSYDIISGVCVLNWGGNIPAVFDEKSNPIEQMPKEIFEIGSCGAAFLGISTKVLNTLAEPFTPLVKEKYGQYYGEDISFCMRAKKAGFKIFCDPSLNIGHIQNKVKYYE